MRAGIGRPGITRPKARAFRRRGSGRLVAYEVRRPQKAFVDDLLFQLTAFQTVVGLLAPDALALSDGGGKVRAALRPLRGREEVGSVLLAIAHKQTTPMVFQLVTANKRLGIIILEEGRVATFATIVADAAGLIRWIYMMRNPDKLPATPEKHMP